MKIGSGYIPVESVPPFKGLATSYPSDALPPQYSPSMQNIAIRDGIITRRAGGNQLGQDLVGRVLAFINFAPLGTTPYLVAFTSKRQYYYNASTNKFVDLTDGQVSYTITAIGTSGSYFRIAGDHVADFTVGQQIPVVAGANEGVYVVDTVTLVTGNTHIATTPPSPTQTVAGAIVIADELTTGTLDQIDAVVLTDINSHRCLMTNGKDGPLVWDGDVSHVFEAWAPNYTDFVTCKSLAVFNEHLFLGGVVIAAAPTESVTVAWSKAGDFDEFEDGDAGAQILYQLVTGIQRMDVLGDRLAIYSADTIVTGMYNGLPAVFIFETVIPQGTRLAAPNAITSLNIGHVFVSEENFYLFDGTRGLRVLGENIYSDYKVVKDFSYLYKTSCLTDFSKRTMYFAVPDGSSGTTVYTARYDIFNLADIIWCKEKYAYDARAWGFYINDSVSILWEDAAWEPVDSAWGDELGSWNEEGERLNFPIRVYGTSTGQVVLVTEGTLPDCEVPVYQEYHTKDFQASEPVQGGGLISPTSVLGRWGEIEIEAKGSGVIVAYSTDQGSSWTTAATLALTSRWTNYQIPIDVSSRTLRVRFGIIDGLYSLRLIRLWYKPGGPQ